MQEEGEEEEEVENEGAWGQGHKIWNQSLGSSQSFFLLSATLSCGKLKKVYFLF